MIDLLKVTKAYMEPQRHYHTLTHIMRMIETIKQHKLDVTDEQLIAIWYHDVVYDPHASDNERQSAYVAVSDMSNAGMKSNSIDVVEQIILDTQNHLPTIGQSRLVIDLDLMGLADPVNSYFETGKLVRKEYVHLLDEQWQIGRRKFVEKFLGRNHIFQTSWGIEHFERGTFNNLTRELELLNDTNQ
jgi:predicted metal-dependent HD superfamily phosphohydrolase